MSDDAWMFRVDGTSLFVGPVVVVKRSKKTAVISCDYGRVSGYRRTVGLDELFASRADAIRAAEPIVGNAVLKLRQDAMRLEEQLSAAGLQDGFFDGWSFKWSFKS